MTAPGSRNPPASPRAFRRRPAFLEARAAGLRIVHRADVRPEWVVQALAVHRENAARGRETCEHWGPGSTVSRVVLPPRAGGLDLAVKWNHPRGLRGMLSDLRYGSRAARAAAGAFRLDALQIPHPETLAVAERRVLGLVTQSFLITGFLDGSAPLPAAMPALRREPKRRRALAERLGETIGALHAAALDHSDLKHSNLLVTRDDEIALLDLDTLQPPRSPTWRRRVRALGQLEAYAVDLYPWLPRTDRTRFLRGYFRREPSLYARRRELLAAVHGWVAQRLSRWARQPGRRGEIHFPLAPRDAAPGAEPTRDARTVADADPGRDA